MNTNLKLSDEKLLQLAAMDVDGTIPDPDIIRRSGINIEVTDELGKTPLMRAAECSPENTRRLIQAGANIDAINDKTGMTPLHYAAKWDWHGKSVEYLLAYGANPSIEDMILKIPALCADNPDVADLLRRAVRAMPTCERPLCRHGSVENLRHIMDQSSPNGDNESHTMLNIKKEGMSVGFYIHECDLFVLWRALRMIHHGLKCVLEKYCYGDILEIRQKRSLEEVALILDDGSLYIRFGGVSVMIDEPDIESIIIDFAMVYPWLPMANQYKHIND